MSVNSAGSAGRACQSRRCSELGSALTDEGEEVEDCAANPSAIARKAKRSGTLTLAEVVVKRSAGQNDALGDPERRDGVVQLAVLAALQPLSFVDDEAVPAVDATEHASVALDSLVRGEHDMRLQGTTRVEQLVFFDDLARFAVALCSPVSEGRRSHDRLESTYVVRDDPHGRRPLLEFAHPCRCCISTAAEHPVREEGGDAQLPMSEFGTTTRKGRAPSSRLR